jgi:hypothetical protein
MKSKTNLTMEDKLLDIIEMLEDAISSEDWDLVETAKKELNFLYDELESPFGIDDMDSDEF